VRVIGENIELVCTGPKDLGVVRADLGQIEQVIMNLVVNAHDAMPQGGRLIISTANVDLDEDEARAHSAPPGPYVLLSVADTGVGMDPETQSHIFEPFFTTKAQGKGTGLGLSTVFGITQQSGGHITVYSEPGHGTTFKIYFPRVVGAAESGPGRVLSVSAPGGTETILLAEDEAPLRTLMGRRLRELGYQVLLASDGLEALAIQRAHQGPLQLVISDVVMPRMGGPELVHRLLPLVPGLRVLFISGYAAEALSPAEFEGAQPGYLQKPFTPEALARKVREVLDRTRVQGTG
jgi:CheY-like chemotaxis protein